MLSKFMERISRMPYTSRRMCLEHYKVYQAAKKAQSRVAAAGGSGAAAMSEDDYGSDGDSSSSSDDDAGNGAGGGASSARLRRGAGAAGGAGAAQLPRHAVLRLQSLPHDTRRSLPDADAGVAGGDRRKRRALNLSETSAPATGTPLRAQLPAPAADDTLSLLRHTLPVPLRTWTTYWTEVGNRLGVQVFNMLTGAYQTIVSGCFGGAAEAADGGDGEEAQARGAMHQLRALPREHDLYGRTGATIAPVRMWASAARAAPSCRCSSLSRQPAAAPPALPRLH